MREGGRKGGGREGQKKCSKRRITQQNMTSFQKGELRRGKIRKERNEEREGGRKRLETSVRHLPSAKRDNVTKAR